MLLVPDGLVGTFSLLESAAERFSYSETTFVGFAAVMLGLGILPNTGGTNDVGGDDELVRYKYPST